MLNAMQKKPVWKFLVYGDPGLGKTHLSVTMPDPVVFLSERHGFETIRTAASMLGKPVPPTFWIRDAVQLARATEILKTVKNEPLAALCMDPTVVPDADLLEAGMTRAELVESLPYRTPRSVSYDSISEVGDIVSEVVDRMGGRGVKDGLPFRKRNAWGVIEEKLGAFLRSARDLPYHVLFICLVNERNHGTDENPDVRFEPMIPGKKLPKKLCSVVNAVGHMRLERKRVGQGENARLEMTRSVHFVMSDRYKQKCAAPLRNAEAPDVGAWITALSLGEVIEGPVHVVANQSDHDSAITAEDEVATRDHESEPEKKKAAAEEKPKAKPKPKPKAAAAPSAAPAADEPMEPPATI